MAASAEVIPVNLNSRKVLSTICLCLLTVLLISLIGIASTFVIAFVISVTLLWYFWTETWFSPSDTRVFVTGKRDTNAGQQEIVQPGQSPVNDDSLPPQDWRQSTDEQTIDSTKNLTRKPLRARRTNAYSDSKLINGGRNSLDTSANIFNSMNKSRRRESFISSPARGSGLAGFGNLTYAALAGNSPKSLISPRENMSFSSSFLYSPNKLSSPNSSLCSSNHRHYPTHQPEYSGLGQLPVVRWNEATSSSPVWKRRTSMQSPVMVRIAPPARVRSENPLVQSIVEDKNLSVEEKSNPCNKASVIAAIKECRKRRVDDDDEDANSRPSTPREQSKKRRRVDGFSRSSTPSMASSAEYETAPPSGRTSATGSMGSDVLGPTGILSKTPRNAILSSFSSAKRVPKRKLSKSDDEDEEEIDISPSKKPTLGLDATTEEPNLEDSNSDHASKNGNKENRPATPQATPAKKGRRGDDADSETESYTPDKSENRTPRKRSLRHLLARQKTPLRGAALYARAATMMSNSPGEYTSADLQEDRHMARQRVSYIREALQEPEPPPPVTTTGPAVATSTSTSAASISLLSNNLASNPLSNTQTASKTITASLTPSDLLAKSKPSTASSTPSGLLAALIKQTSTAGPTTATSSAAATSKVTLKFTATSSAAPSQTPGFGVSTASSVGSSLLSGSKPSQAPASSAANSGFFAGLSSTNKPAATSTTNSGLPPPPSYSAAQALLSNPGSLQSSTSQSTVTAAPSVLTSSILQQKPANTPTSNVGFQTQQIKAQDAGSAPNLTTTFQMSKPQTAPGASTLTNSQTSTPFNFGASSAPLNSKNTSSNLTSSIFSSAPTSTAPNSQAPSASIFNTPQQSAARPKSPFKPIFPSAAAATNATSAQQTSTFNFAGNTAASTAPSSTVKSLFNTQTTSSSSAFGSSNPTAKPGGFQFNTSTTSNSNQSKTSSTPFQFGATANQTSTATTTATSQPSSSLFTFGGAQNTQTNPSPFGATSTAGQTQNSMFGGQQATTSQSQNQTNMFGSAAKPAFGSQPAASPFGSVASSSTTTTTQNPFGATAPQTQTQNMFGQQQQAASPFGGTPQTQTQNPFGGGTPAQTQNAFGASTQAPASSSGVFTFGGNNAAKPAASGGASSGFNFGAAAQPNNPSSGFNFSAAASTQNTGYNFGQSQPQPQQQQQSQASSGFQFGQQTPAQSSQPFGGAATPQPFNFGAGGSGFASAPASGRSTPVGNFSVGASSGTSTAAQRRARLRQARGRSGRR